MLKQLAFAAFTAAVLGASAAAPAGAGPRGGCDEWGCGMNGTQVTGIAEHFAGLHPNLVSAVIMPRSSVDQEPQTVVAVANEGASKQDELRRKKAQLRKAQEQFE